jgi:hypothetical protein
MKKVCLLLTAAVFLVCTTEAWAATVTLRFNELPFQPVDGLNYLGVNFGFTVGGVPSNDAHYNSGGPGQIRYVQDPSLEGAAAGTLTIAFDNPTPVLQFGVALSTLDTLDSGFQVQLFDSDFLPLGTYQVVTSKIVSFTESRFSYQGRKVSQAVITFYAPAGRFALDNLTYEDPTATETALGSNNATGGTPWR